MLRASLVNLFLFSIFINWKQIFKIEETKKIIFKLFKNKNANSYKLFESYFNFYTLYILSLYFLSFHSLLISYKMKRNLLKQRTKMLPDIERVLYFFFLILMCCICHRVNDFTKMPTRNSFYLSFRG